MNLANASLLNRNPTLYLTVGLGSPRPSSLHVAVFSVGGTRAPESARSAALTVTIHAPHVASDLLPAMLDGRQPRWETS